MSRRIEIRTLGFLVSLAIGGLVVAALLASEVAEFAAIAAGWLVFMIVGWGLATRGRR